MRGNGEEGSDAGSSSLRTQYGSSERSKSKSNRFQTVIRDVMVFFILFVTPVVLVIGINVMAVAPVTFLGTALYLFTLIFIALCGSTQESYAFEGTPDKKSSNKGESNASTNARASFMLYAFYFSAVTLLVLWSWAFILRYRFGGEEVNIDYAGVSLGGVGKTWIVFTGREPTGRGIYVDVFPENVATSASAPINTAFVNVSADRDYTGAVRMDGLSPGVHYVYKARVASNAREDFDSGSFHTLNGANVSFAFSSCTMLRQGFAKKLNGVATLNSKIPNLDFYAMLGDTIYADVPFLYKGLGSNKEKYFSMYRETLGTAEYLELRSKLPGFYQIDDHEILNDVDENVEDRPIDFYLGTDTDPLVETSLTFRTAVSAWNNYLGIGNTGNMTKPYHVIDAGVATFFFLDTRTSRVASNGTTPKSFLGRAQRKALRAWLSSAKPDQFKVIVSPQPWTRNMVEHGNEGWVAHIEERDAILDYIQSNAIGGCVFLSADLHQVGVYELRPGLLEFSVSPLDATGQISDYAPLDLDPELYEQWHYNEAFALVDVNATTFSVRIYQGGTTLLNGVAVAAGAVFITLALAIVVARKSSGGNIGPRRTVALLFVLPAVFLLMFACTPSGGRGFDAPRAIFSVDLATGVHHRIH